MIAALAKAQSLKNHLTGVETTSSSVTLTDEEAAELLWEVGAAVIGIDPWQIIHARQITIHGFPLERLPH